MTVTRRTFLAGTAAASIPVAVAAVPALTPRGRLEAAIAELKEAAEAFDPSIKKWNVAVSDEPKSKCRLVIASFDL